MDIQILGRSNGCSGKGVNFFEKFKQTLEHTSNLSFRSFDWQDKIKVEGWPTRCVNGRGCSTSGLGA